MRIGVPKEIVPGETRIAASPDSIRKFTALGVDVLVESGAGAGAQMSDEVLTQAGARIAVDARALYGDADLVAKVRAPLGDGNGADELSLMRPKAVLVGLLAPLQQRGQVARYAAHGVTAFAMELIPRISRAQSMDALSSQSNIAGYKAVIDAADHFGRILPMMMTAAGTVAPARVVVLGAGVAGLQAIATARRLGALVSAFDVRPAVKEQVQSLGAKFISVDADAGDAETAGGYAREMDDAYKDRQSALIHETLKKQDICITTAQIPRQARPGADYRGDGQGHEARFGDRRSGRRERRQLRAQRPRPGGRAPRGHDRRPCQLPGSRAGRYEHAVCAQPVQFHRTHDRPGKPRARHRLGGRGDPRSLADAGRRGRASGAPGRGGLVVEHVLELHPLVIAITIFVLAVFIGYYVVWSVTPALHTPLMSVTNAISSVIIVGALLAATPAEGSNVAKILGGVAVGLAAVNIFGGFTVTHRMLQMFKKKK